MKAEVLAEPVLVGRERELEELRRCLGLAVDGKGNTVFVVGEAGSGKTRLVREFLDVAREKHVAVLAGWCLSDAATPYFPFVEAFNSYFSRFEDDQPASVQAPGTPLGFAGNAQIPIADRGITAWLAGPKLAQRLGRPEAVSPQAWKDQVFAGVARTLHLISAQEPVILFLEDVHWADSASLALLHYIARTVKGYERILVLSTFRSEELTVDVEGRPHPLAETLRMMDREDLYKMIKLKSLNHAEVSRVAESMMGGSLQQDFAQKLGAESRGNPLFVVESLRMLSEQGNLHREEDGWRLSVDALGIPRKLKNIILRRLSVLKLDQRRILDAASVIGEKFDPELLGNVLGEDTLEVLEALNTIAQSTSLVRVEGGFFRFDHAKSREAVYEEIPLPLKKGYHARVAERLENSGKGERLPFGEIAFHYAAASNEAKAVRFAFDAGQDALARFSNAEAAKHFAYVLEKTADTPENAENRRIALEGLGDAYYSSGLFAKALEVFERLGDSEVGAVKLRAYRKAADAIFFGTKEWNRFPELVKKAEPFAGADRLESARIRFLKGTALLGLEKIEACLEEFEGALRVFEEEYSLSDVARALTAIGTTRGGGGVPEIVAQYERALSASLRSIALHEELGDLRWLVDALAHAGGIFLVYGLVDEAEETLKKAVRVSEKIGDYAKIYLANRTLGFVYEGLSRVEEALGATLRAAEYSEKTDAQINRSAVYVRLVKLYSKLGDVEQARTCYSKASGLLSGTEPRDVASVGPGFSTQARLGWEIPLTQAVFLAAQNKWKEANEQFDKALEIVLEINRAMRKEKISFTPVDYLVKREIVWALNRQGRTKEAEILTQELRGIREELLGRFAHVNLNANLMARTNVFVGQEFEVRLDLVNISRAPGFLLKVEGWVPTGLEVAPSQPLEYVVDKGSAELGRSSINAFQVKTLKIKLRATEAGAFSFNPTVFYVDDLGETKTCKPNPVIVTVKQPQPEFEGLPDRVATGFTGLDRLLLGGIPERYAVALASMSSEERRMIVQSFVEKGAEAREKTLFLTVEAGNASNIAEKYPSNFFLIVCSPQADTMARTCPNVAKLKGVENLTEIDIALTRALRALDGGASGFKRACVEVVSDVLLQHHAVTTRKWLSALLTNLKSTGFTVLAVVDPTMHASEEVQAVLGLFDGELRVYERETAGGVEKVLRVRSLFNRRYLEDELILERGKMDR